MAWPGTVTGTELLGAPSRSLGWLSPLTPMTFQSSSRPSSPSQDVSKSRKSSRLTDTPSVPTAIGLDMSLPDAHRHTPPARIVHCIILAQLTDAKTPPAPRAVTPRPFLAAARPRLPPPPTVVITTMPSPSNTSLDLSRLHEPRPPDLPNTTYLTPPRTVRKSWM